MIKNRKMFYYAFIGLCFVIGLAIAGILRVENLNDTEIMYLFGVGLNKNGWILTTSLLIFVAIFGFSLPFLTQVKKR